MTPARWLLVAFFGLTTLGCSDADRGPALGATSTATTTSWRDGFPDVHVVPPGRWSSTPLNVPVWVVTWLDRPEYATLRAAALDELDTTAAEIDTRFNVVPPGTLGPPPGWRVVGMDPGAFSFQPSPTGLAMGYADLQRGMIYVSWRPTTADALHFPALAHEYGHAWAYVMTGGDAVLAGQHGHAATSSASPGGVAHHPLHCGWGLVGF